MKSLFSLGVKSGFPGYVILVCVIQTCVLFVPESAWAALGIDALSHLQGLPVFVQHYVNSSNFKNSMLIFWLLSPVTLSTNSVLWLIHINFQGYAAYLQRRLSRLKLKGKTSDYSLIAGILIFILAYVWYTGINLKQPLILGNFVPTKNRIAMLLVHGGAISLILPICISMLITEIRANFTSAELHESE